MLFRNTMRGKSVALRANQCWRARPCFSFTTCIFESYKHSYNAPPPPHQKNCLAGVARQFHTSRAIFKRYPFNYRPLNLHQSSFTPFLGAAFCLRCLRRRVNARAPKAPKLAANSSAALLATPLSDVCGKPAACALPARLKPYSACAGTTGGCSRVSRGWGCGAGCGTGTGH